MVEKQKTSIRGSASRVKHAKGWRQSSGESADEQTALALATRTGRKALGLLLSAPNDKELLLMPCNDVHTVGMRHALDVAFVNREGRVIEAHCAVGPFRRLRNGKAVAVVERFASCDVPWFAEGDQVVLSGRKEATR